MIHLTLNTGHSLVQNRAKVQPGVVEAMRVLLPQGGNLGAVAPDFSAFRVEISRDATGDAFTIYRGRDALVTNLLCREAGQSDTLWNLIENTYLKATDRNPQLLAASAAPAQPETTPWLATLLLPGLGLLTRDDALWLGDFEHCLAVTLLET